MTVSDQLPGVPSPVSTSLRNLRAALRFAFFRPVRAQEFAFSGGQIAVFVALQLTLLLVYDFAKSGQYRVFDVYAVTSVGTDYLLLVLSMYLLSMWLGGITFFAPPCALCWTTPASSGG